MNLSHYAVIAKLLEYPEENFGEILKKVESIDSEKYPEAVKELESFKKLLPLETYDMQELYCRSFEVQALTSLYIGYVLFGDDYKRGDMLAKFSVEHKKAGNKDLKGELPDFLPNVLRLISILAEKNEDALVEEMVTQIVGQAVKKMIAEYEPTSIKQKEEMYKKEHKVVIESFDSVTAYDHCLRALYSMLNTDFTLIEVSEDLKDASFFKFIQKELEIEGKGDQSLGNAAACATSSCSTSCN